MPGAISVARWLSSRLFYFGYDDCEDEIRATITPKSWTYLGMGSTRVAWLDPRNTVWKVEQAAWAGTNAEEHERSVDFRTNCKELLNKYPSIVIPETALYTVKGQDILAMEYFEGNLPTETEWDNLYHTGTLRLIERDFGICDLHWGNVIMANDGRIVIVDFAT